MQPSAEKRQALERATELLSSSDELNLRYAALELRRCVEAIVYEKLMAYQDRFPPEVAKKWQPPQAFRALLVMEPDAEQTVTIRYAREAVPGIQSQGSYRTLGTDYRFTLAWLNKTYNKLGSFLHASWPFAKNPTTAKWAETKEFLQKVATDLQPFVEKTFTSTLAETIVFNCTECGTTIKANAAGVQQAGEITCLNSDCKSHYVASINGTDYSFQLDAIVADCPKCTQAIKIPTQRLAMGYQFPCSGCGQKYSIVNQAWEFDEIKTEHGST
jgi:hypothetical protein